ncbi:MAG: hypothetical protein AAF242_16660, partial [Bacteroidota bacterium]
EDLDAQETASLDTEEIRAYAQTTMNRRNSQYHERPRGWNTNGNGKVEMRPIVDPKTGKTSAYAPLPNNWKLGEIWESPNGTKVELRQGGTADLRQRPYQSIDQLLQQYLLPEFKKVGAHIDNIIDLPGIAQNNERIYSLYWRSMPSQDTHQAKGIEVSDPSNGEKGLIIVNFMLIRSEYGSYNYYSCNVMSAKGTNYEADKKILINALENMQMDRQAVAMHNQMEQQRSQAGWAAHNQRMAQKQQAFDAHQQRHREMSEMRDAQFESYMNRSRSNDRIHQAYVNSIWEENTAVNPHNGQQMNTSIHYKYNYVNQNGQVFGTNNPNYNPAQDPNLNHMTWKKVNR